MIMKRKLLAFAVVPMLLLTGVGCESEFKKDEAMETSVKQNKKEDYNKNVSYLLKNFSHQTKEISNLLDSGKSMEKKSEKLKELSKPYFELIDKINDLDYDLGKKPEVKKDVGEAMLIARSSVDLAQMGLKDDDKDSIKSSLKDLESVSETADKVSKDLDKK